MRLRLHAPGRRVPGLRGLGTAEGELQSV